LSVFVVTAKVHSPPAKWNEESLPAARTTVQCVVAKMSPCAVEDSLECSEVKAK
jgi:hypothetical protein